MLHYTHDLTVNPKGEPILSKSKLWSGLLLRVVEQTAFTPGLDRVELIEEGLNFYRRRLYFGQHVLTDRVLCVPLESVSFITDEAENFPTGRLRIKIIEDNDELSLRFDYETNFPVPNHDEERHLLEVVKSAYQAADMDVIRVIRDLLLSTKP